MSNPKVKGLLKGLRYISQIFDEKEEDEIQIGFPTDVKHVAHIGWDGPSANTPSWMQDFKAGPEIPSEAVAAAQSTQTKVKKSKAGGSKHNKDIPTPRSRHDSIDSLPSQPNSPARSSDGSKHSRRNRSSDPSGDSGSSRPRRHRHSNKEAESHSSDSTAAVPKSSRRRKTKTSSGDGSTRSTASSTKAGSMTDISLPEIGSDL